MEEVDEDRHSQIVAMLENGTDTESEEEFEDSEEQTEDEEAESSGEDEFEEEVEEEEEDVPEGHRVPYDRFKQVNDQRQELRSQLDDKQRFIEELEARMKGSKEPEPEYEEDFYEEEDYLSDEPDLELAQLRTQTQAMQVKFATMELETEIAAAQSEYPNVPAEYLWESIAQDGNQQAMAIAQQYSTWVVGVEEAAIARYLQSGQADESAEAPPRPSRKQSTRSSGQPRSAPRNTDEAKDAMLAYLKG